MYPTTYQQSDPMRIIKIFFYGVLFGLFLAVLLFVKFPNSLPTESPISNVRLGATRQSVPPRQEEMQEMPSQNSMRPTILVSQQTEDAVQQYSSGSNALARPISPVASPTPSPMTRAVAHSAVGSVAHSPIHVEEIRLYNATVSEVMALRSEATVQGHFIRRLQLGEKVEVVEVSESFDIIKLHDDAPFPIRGQWYKVRTTDNLEGWAFEAAFRERFKRH